MSTADKLRKACYYGDLRLKATISECADELDAKTKALADLISAVDATHDEDEQSRAIAQIALIGQVENARKLLQ